MSRRKSRLYQSESDEEELKDVGVGDGDHPADEGVADGDGGADDDRRRVVDLQDHLEVDILILTTIVEVTEAVVHQSTATVRCYQKGRMAEGRQVMALQMTGLIFLAVLPSKI